MIELPDMKVICIKQPWAWLIVAGHKDIENRNWKTTHRGPVLISASAHRRTAADMAEAVAFAHARGVGIIPVDELHYGGVIGCASVTCCAATSKSQWFQGPIGWVLEDPVQIPFIPMSGRLGLFEAPAHVLKSLPAHIVT